MKRVALLLICALFGQALLHAQQEVYWSEDFGNGPMGWTYSTSLCGNFNQPHNGVWTLSTLTHDGTTITDVSIQLGIATNRDYVIRINKDGEESFAQAFYTLLLDTVTDVRSMGSNLPAETITLGERAHGNMGLSTTWFTNLQLTEDDLNAWGRTALLLDEPIYTLMGNTLTVTSADGLTVMTFAKTASCATSWLWSDRGHVGTGLVAANELAITSPTASNGAMVVNGDFYITSGTINPGAPPYPQFISELISPVIDLSGVADAVSLEFNQLVRVLNLAAGASFRRAVSTSIDGGETWSDPIDVNPTLQVNAPALNNNRPIIPLPGLQGQANVRIKFIYGSDFYFWVLDDIAIVSRVTYDMQVNQNFFAIMPNAVTPISQVEAVPFLADVQNNGGRTATNVELNLTITNDISNEVVYDSDVLYGDIAPDVLEENYIFDELLDPANLTVGSFTGVYSISHDSTEIITTNDRITWTFQVSDTLFAKELGRTRGISPAANPSFSYGNVFFAPNGSGHFARYVTFGVDNATLLMGRTLTVELYEWEGDLNDDGTVQPEEYGSFPIAFNEYTIVGDEAMNLITIPVDLEGEGVALQDNKYYIIALTYNTTDDQACSMQASAAFNHNAMFFATDSLGFARYGSVLTVGPTEVGSVEYSVVGFGFGFVPLVRLSIGDNPDLEGPPFMVINTEDRTLLDGSLAKVFPNPAAERVQVQLELNRPTDVRLSMVDLTGRVVLNQKYNQVAHDTVSLDVSRLAPGKYWVRIQTDEGIIVKPVVVAR